MENVAIGEGLAQAGPMNEIPAALAFYRALRVYPSPVELIMSEFAVFVLCLCMTPMRSVMHVAVESKHRQGWA